MGDLHTIAVDGAHCIGEARREAAAAALAIGFNARAVEEVSIIVTELATNLARHTTHGGAIQFQRVQTGPFNGARTGIEIVSVDTGPGIVDVERALAGGFSTAGSLGQGLSAVKRLADVFDIHSRTVDQPGPPATNPRNHIGTVIAARKWLAAPLGSASGGGFEHSVFSRPHPAEKLNGDAFYRKDLGDVMLVAVFDALGHGSQAHAAARAALDDLETHHLDPLEAIVRGLHQQLRGTRGGVLGLARLDYAARTLSYCGVGNIDARVLRAPVSTRPFSHAGTLGATLPRVEVQTFPWFPGALLVLASDGISTKWDLAQYPGLAERRPSIIAATLLRDFVRAEDDATVAVMQWRAHP